MIDRDSKGAAIAALIQEIETHIVHAGWGKDGRGRHDDDQRLSMWPPIHAFASISSRALNIARICAGESSDHYRNLVAFVAVPSHQDGYHLPEILGYLLGLQADLDRGLLVNVDRAAAGEVVAEFVSLSRQVMADDNGDDAKNVAAVLAAAAYEDTIRRMGRDFAGVTDRPKLEKVIGALKDAGVLRGAQVSIASSYLRFRNDALHADWSNLDRSSVAAVQAFVEALLLEHFR